MTTYHLAHTMRGNRRHLVEDEGERTLCGAKAILVTRITSDEPVRFAPHWDDWQMCFRCLSKFRRRDAEVPRP